MAFRCVDTLQVPWLTTTAHKACEVSRELHVHRCVNGNLSAAL